MPVHRDTLIAHRELEEAEENLAGAVEELKVEILERDLQEALKRLEKVREEANRLESTLLRVRR